MKTIKMDLERFGKELFIYIYTIYIYIYIIILVYSSCKMYVKLNKYWLFSSRPIQYKLCKRLKLYKLSGVFQFQLDFINQ